MHRSEPHVPEPADALASAGFSSPSPRHMNRSFLPVTRSYLDALRVVAACERVAMRDLVDQVVCSYLDSYAADHPEIAGKLRELARGRDAAR
jgi:hypothetical protein